jgi:thiamine biosynthesis lipoprotein
MSIKPAKLSRLFVVIIFFLAFILALLSALLFPAKESVCAYFAEESGAMVWRQQSFPVMGTMVEVNLYGRSADLDAAVDEVRTEFNKVHNICNVFDPNSELSRLNATAAERAVRTSPLLTEILQRSREAYERTDHAFDISVKPLMGLWGFHRKRNTMPSQPEISAALHQVGLNKVIFNDVEHSVKFTVPGMAFDLGGIAKGVALSRAVAVAKKHHINTGIINAGGNLYCLPELPDGRKFNVIGIRHPFDTDAIYGSVNVNGKAVSTSGGYEWFVTIAGQTYAHIMDPRTGMPANQIVAVTVVAADATIADYLSTAIFVGGASFLATVSKNFPDAAGVIFQLNPDHTIHTVTFGNIDYQKINPEQQ